MKVMISARISFGVATDDVTDHGAHFFSPALVDSCCNHALRGYVETYSILSRVRTDIDRYFIAIA
jgi:hypothetical protein